MISIVKRKKVILQFFNAGNVLTSTTQAGAENNSQTRKTQVVKRESVRSITQKTMAQL